MFTPMEPAQIPDHVRSHLDPKEQPVIVRRFHWATILEPMAVVVVGLFVSFGVDVTLHSTNKNSHTVAWIVWAAWLLWTASVIWDLSSVTKRVRTNGRSQVIGLLLAVGAIYAGTWLTRTDHFGSGGLLLIVFLVVLAWAVVEVAHWWERFFVVTNKRIMVIEGLIARNINSMPLTKLTDMIYRRSPVGQILNYGFFDVESAGQDQALKKINFVPDPDNTNLQITHLLWFAG